MVMAAPVSVHDIIPNLFNFGILHRACRIPQHLPEPGGRPSDNGLFGVGGGCYAVAANP